MKPASREDRAAPGGVATNAQKRPFSSAPIFETADDYAFAMLGFSTGMSLIAIVAAIFTTIVFLPPWRYFWLAICIVTFALAVVGIVLLFQRNQILQRKSETSEIDESPGS